MNTNQIQWLQRGSKYDSMGNLQFQYFEYGFALLILELLEIQDFESTDKFLKVRGDDLFEVGAALKRFNLIKSDEFQFLESEFKKWEAEQQNECQTLEHLPKIDQFSLLKNELNGLIKKFQK